MNQRQWDQQQKFIEDLEKVLNDIKALLINKNTSYGDAALNPIRVFAKSDSIEQINVRIDDKLNRLIQGKEYQNEDTEWDLLGYLILKQIAKNRTTNT